MHECLHGKDHTSQIAMHELEELLKEILDELDYLKKREEIHQHKSYVLFLSLI
jgi:hypothetical protein